jgi:exonuclease SbcC
MKILNIYFKNINSLEGESRIHFDQTPIADAGVFAITGPNGSGKSSILDVITLGLYGETFRFDRPADHVMTKSTAESLAEVEFSLGDDKFRSSWYVKREDGNSTAELLAPEMKLIQLNGSEQILEDSTQKVRDKMAELTGMDFHKFSKSMVLAQGDFAAFLNALDSERMDILEKISGTDIYAEYKEQAEEKNTQAQARMLQLEQDRDAIPIMDDATKEACEYDLVDFKDQLADLNDEQTEVTQQLTQVQKMVDLENQIESLTEKQQHLKNQRDENHKNLEQIEASQEVMRFQQDIAVLDNKVDETQQSKKMLDSYHNELAMIQKQLNSSAFDENSAVPDKTFAEQKNSIDKLKLSVSELKFNLPKETALLQSLNQKLEEKKPALDLITSWLQEHAADESLLESFPEIVKLSTLRVELAELTDKQKAYTKWSKSTTEGLRKNKEDISSLRTKNKDLKVQIENNERSLEKFAEGLSLYDLQEMKVEQQERVDNFVELLDLASVNAKLGKKGFFSLFSNSKSEHQEETDLKAKADHLQMEIGREQNIIKTLEQAVSNERLLQKMQPDRVHLVDGKPCPLCGALEHPYSKHAPTVANSKQALLDQQKKVKALIASAESLGKEIILAQKKAEQDEQKANKLEGVRSQWNALANRLNIASIELDIDNLSLIKDLLKTEKTELINIGNLEKKYAKKQDSITSAKSYIETNEAALIRLTKETADLETDWNSRPQELIDLEQALSKCQTEEQVLSEKVVAQLNKLGEKMPGKKKENVLLERLKARKQEYQSKASRQKSLADEIQDLDQKVLTCSSKIDQINKDIQQYSGKVQHEEMAGLHLSIVEKQKLIAEKETLYSRQEAELVTLNQSLSDKIKDTQQSDLTAVRETIALIQRQPELQQQQLELKQNISNIKNNLEKAQSDLEAEQTSELTKSTEDEILGQQKSIKEKLDITQQEIKSIQNKLNKQNDLQEKYTEVSTKLEGHKALVEASEADVRLIEDENGIQFRRKVQQIMTDKLLSQANQILEKLSGRYYVRKRENEHGLGLEIEDTKQHNVRRLPKTLSGGESFIVSLALALALAEMAHNGHAVDSLFLDEGFGTLDAESLYLAMTTLESLKTHGKTVGVISHVEGVSKRIKTQIEMIKKPNGFSGLKMVS